MTDKEIYQQFCDKEKKIPIFSQPWYLDTVCGENGWDILMVKKGDEIAATMPLTKQKKWGFQFSRMPLATTYLGPYFPEKFRIIKQQQKLIPALIAQFPKIYFFQQNFHPSLTNHLPFYWTGFTVAVYYSFVIDLTERLDNIYKNITSNYRNNKISKAQKTVRITSDYSLQHFFQALQKTFHRQGLSSPFSLNFMKKYDAVLDAQNARKIFFAVDQQEQIHSAIYLIWDEETAYLQMIGDDPRLRKSGASILLIWHVIQYAKEVLQKKRFDFAGSVIEPITKVREDFGAKQVPYFQGRRFESKVLEMLYLLK